MPPLINGGTPFWAFLPLLPGTPISPDFGYFSADLREFSPLSPGIYTTTVAPTFSFHPFGVASVTISAGPIFGHFFVAAVHPLAGFLLLFGPLLQIGVVWTFGVFFFASVSVVWGPLLLLLLRSHIGLDFA